jgi:oxaloacetate decarboxylase beta subunit
VLLARRVSFGIYGTLLLAVLLGFEMNEAASIGVIGAIDGPTAILSPRSLPPICWDRWRWLPIPT